MNRRQLALVIILNALISLTIAVAVVWVVEQRRPDPEVLAALATPLTAPVIAPTFTSTPAAVASPQSAPDAATPEATAATDAEEVYVVQAGDSLLAIAGRYGVTMQAVMDANNLTNPDFVFSGQRLVIPREDVQPTVSTAQPAPLAVTNTPAAGEGIRVASFTGNGILSNESVQIANDSDLVINLQGWRLEKENGPAYLFGGISLFPGSGVVLYTGPGADTSVALYWNQAAPVWQTGSVARLINPQGQEISRLTAP
ncbi:MAG: lamin tail domain-containing protein [Caldilineaceae bacterium]|jgi:LysM repeat protein|nr:lamin tail domain-containing protein [Caldilineaceae bacterium]